MKWILLLLVICGALSGCTRGYCVQECRYTVKDACNDDIECVKESLKNCFEACGRSE